MEVGEGVDFLGFHHRMVRSLGLGGKKQVTFVARWPADKAMQWARDRIRELTDRRRLRLRLPVEAVVQDINVFLRGWAGYFRYGNSAQRFDKIRQYTMTRLAIFVGKKHKHSRGYGWSAVGYLSPTQYGLIRLAGTIVAPRPFQDWRARPNAGGERRR